MSKISRQILIGAFAFYSTLPMVAQARVVQVENVVFEKPANYDKMSRREQLLTFIRANKALKSNQTMKMPQFLLKPGQSGADLDREIRNIESELTDADNIPRRENYMRELSSRVEAAINFDERQKVLSSLDASFKVDGRELWLTRQEQIKLLKSWLGKSRERDLRDQLIEYLKPINGVKAAVPEILAYAKELTTQDLPRISATPGLNMFSDETPNGDLTRGYRALQVLLDTDPANSEVQQLLGKWLEKAASAEPFEFYGKLSPENQRKAKERLEAVIEPSYADADERELDTHSFLVLCRLSAKLQPQPVSQAVETLAKIERTDLGKIEQVSVPEVARALGSLRAVGVQAEGAVPTLLKVLDAKSNDYALVVKLPNARFHKVRRRLEVFRYGAIQALTEINLNWHPETFEAILEVFQQRLRIADYSDSTVSTAQIQLLEDTFSRVSGSNQQMLPAISKALEYEFNGRLISEGAQNRPEKWHQLYDHKITAELLSCGARFKSGAKTLVPYVLTYLDRGGNLLLPFTEKPKYVNEAATALLLAARVDDFNQLKKLGSLLLAVSQEEQKVVAVQGEAQASSEFQIALLEILSQSTSARKFFLTPSYRAVLLRGLERRMPPLRVAAAKVIGTLGSDGAIFVPHLIKALQGEKLYDGVLNQQLRPAGFVLATMTHKDRGVLDGHFMPGQAKEPLITANLQIIRVLQNLGPKATAAIPILEAIAKDTSHSSRSLLRDDAQEALQKIDTRVKSP